MTSLKLSIHSEVFDMTKTSYASSIEIPEEIQYGNKSSGK